MSKPVFRLITIDDYENDESIKRLLEWRIKNRFAYLGDYEITFDSMKSWLKEYVLNNPRRFLFWLLVDNVAMGHIGFNNVYRDSIEVDNVARGLEGYKGVMAEAMKMLIAAYPDKRIWLQVLDDNDHAIEFYERLGFKHTGKKGRLLQMQYE